MVCRFKKCCEKSNFFCDFLYPRAPVAPQDISMHWDNNYLEHALQRLDVGARYYHRNHGARGSAVLDYSLQRNSAPLAHLCCCTCSRGMIAGRADHTGNKAADSLLASKEGRQQILCTILTCLTLQDLHDNKVETDILLT